MNNRMANLSRKFLALAACLVLAAGCNRPSSTETREPDAPPRLPMPSSGPVPEEAHDKALAEFGDSIAAEFKLVDEMAEIDRRTMVSPAPPDFRPEPVARKIRLKLVLEKSKIRAGESPRFRLELTNVGREPIIYQELEATIFKWGSLWDSMRTISFLLVDPRGKELDLLPPLPTGRAEPTRYHDATPESEEKMRRNNALYAASSKFKVKVLPGETLRSLGDGDSAQEPFRTLRVQEGFEKPGKYTLRVVLDDRPAPMNDIYIKALLKIRTMAEIQSSFDQRLKEALGPVSTDNLPLEVVR